MLGLVWTKEQDIKDAVVEAYQRLYISVNAPNERFDTLRIVFNIYSKAIQSTSIYQFLQRLKNIFPVAEKYKYLTKV